MKTKVVFSIVLLACAGVFAADEARRVITGFVEYSFDQKYRLIRTPDTVYELKTDSLGKTATRSLDSKLGTVTSISVPSDGIAQSWPVTGAESITQQSSPDERRPASSDTFSLTSDSLRVSGTIEPSTVDDALLIESEGAYFLIHKASIERALGPIAIAPGRHVDLTVGRSDLLMAWPAADH